MTKTLRAILLILLTLQAIFGLVSLKIQQNPRVTFNFRVTREREGDHKDGIF